MRSPNYITVLTLFFGFLNYCGKASAVLPRPNGRSDWHHEQFQKLHSLSLESGAQTNFGYWCGPTIGGYCGSMSFSDINTNAVTHVPFAFASITADGTVSYVYDQGSVQQYNSSILINQGVMAGLSLGGSGTPADNCLANIDTCVTTLGKTLEYYENMGSPFYFVDSDFEQPSNAAQMQNLITFWLTFNEQFPGYLITMAPECAYLWCGAASWPYNSYVPVMNELGPYGKDIIYKVNAQSYNNWCSESPAGTTAFFQDVATTWITACPSTGYLGLENNAGIFGLGVLAADKDGSGYAPPSVVTQSLQDIGAKYNTFNGMFWDTFTDLGNAWQISTAIDAAAPKSSVAPTFALTAKPSATPTTARPSWSPSFNPTATPTTAVPTLFPTEAPTQPTPAPTFEPTFMPTNTTYSQHQNAGAAFWSSAIGIGVLAAGGSVTVSAVCFLLACYLYKGAERVLGLPNCFYRKAEASGQGGVHARLLESHAQ